MCKAIEDIIAEAKAEVKAETLNEALQKMIANGIPENEAKRILGLS